MMGRSRRPGTLARLALVTLFCGVGIVAIGGEIQFASRIQTKVGSKPATLALTGTAIRKIWGFSVYAISSYVEEGAKVRAAEELATADVLKQLHMVLLRDVDGDDMAKSFEGSLALNDPPGTFDREVAELKAFLGRFTVRKGDHVWLTYQPGLGLRCYVVGKGEVVIRSLPFARALWQVYLGPNNLGVSMKSGLVSRL